MARKSPYRHDVSGYRRYDGVQVTQYQRGKGSKPREMRTTRIPHNSGTKYSITFRFPDGETETYNASGTLTNAVREALSMIQRPMVPKSLTWRMLK